MYLLSHSIFAVTDLPIQLSTHGQWWSNLATQAVLLHKCVYVGRGEGLMDKGDLPMHLSTHRQWWSNLETHQLHTEQYFDPSVCEGGRYNGQNRLTNTVIHPWTMVVKLGNTSVTHRTVL